MGKIVNIVELFRTTISLHFGSPHAKTAPRPAASQMATHLLQNRQGRCGFGLVFGSFVKKDQKVSQILAAHLSAFEGQEQTKCSPHSLVLLKTILKHLPKNT